MPLPKIAIYSANFGNYRNELNYGIDNIYFDRNIDYYFFTDNQNLKSNKWRVIYHKLLPALPFINSTRLTSKYLKFKQNGILKDYDNSMYLIKHGGRLHAKDEIITTLELG